MAAVLVFVIVLLYSPFVLSGVTIGVICDSDCPSVKSYSMFGLFSAPYANLNEKGATDGYYLNYHNQSDDTSVTCDKLSPPLPPPPLINISSDPEFILLLDNYSHCMLERMLLARAVGYDAILSYTVDDTNITITEPIINTGIPIALVQYRYVNSIKNLTYDYSYISITVDGSILSGAIVITTIFVSFVSCFCCICTLCCLCCKIYRDNRDPTFEPLLREDGSRYRSRQELIESILNHLQQMENELGTQTPLGQNQIDKFPKREYSGEGTERDTTCCVCVDDFKPGQEVRQLPCQHIFHPSCIDEWLSDHSSVCPLCKMDLREANNDSTSNPSRRFQERQMERAAARNNARDRSLTDYSSSDNSVDSRRAQSSIPA
ncbi:PREDICTED: E3 ubiquitin-protein ligase RNF13-like [Amphimedon queenslandica]|uniref:RING-type domain-containing protein n=1 Tax=Amphimedon queenslandica TaxID=400682 RepID=A0A1X7VPJ6_AMPQE|nr:PREDICTED: E3 ubiquitin-protein ligase RNF13-like [Amphimedon queenslandica]|eukprot:XP_019858356.1 PREDICTED: E3 ubiquitin-protein ligase RNF13-like [Amphimedon queenslandica]